MPFPTRLRAIRANIETTPGTANTTSMSDAYLPYDLTISPGIQMFQRTPQRIHLGPTGDISAQQMATLSFRTEMRRTNTGTTADDWGVLLQGCGFQEDDQASPAGLIYAPTSLMPGSSTSPQEGDMKTLTFHLYQGGDATASAPKWLLVGCMGNVTFSGSVGEPMFAQWEFMGKLTAAPTDDTLQSVTHESGKPSAFQGVGLTVDSETFVFNSLTLNMGNQVTMREDANDATGYAHALIVSRRPEITIDPEVVPVATWAPITEQLADNTFAVSFTMSSNITCSIPAAQVTQVADQDRNGVSVYGLTMLAQANSSAGNDEVTITKL